MKLSDLHRKPLRENSGGTRDFEDVTELGDELYEPFTMTVSYWYEGASPIVTDVAPGADDASSLAWILRHLHRSSLTPAAGAGPW